MDEMFEHEDRDSGTDELATVYNFQVDDSVHSISRIPSNYSCCVNYIVYVLLLVLGYFSYKYGFIPPYIVLLAILFLFWSLKYGSRKKNKASAYSVFNPGFKKLHGTFSGKDVDKILRRKL